MTGREARRVIIAILERDAQRRALRALHDRLGNAGRALDETKASMLQAGEFDSVDRLNGKIEGVKLARGYIEEELR